MAAQVLRPYDILQPRSRPAANPNPRPQQRRSSLGKQRERLPKPAKAPVHAKGAALGRPHTPRKAAEVYAGSGFANSPAPSALPLPRFSLKKDAPAVGEYLATMALRRMLRLETEKEKDLIFEGEMEDQLQLMVALFYRLELV
ncbi:hypothetical protein ZIOFF_065399 [Zingiber officinale]|uniref:Uncharacterized protein n=2 Tax=Zingiber officinale TaxID=94328 RepID=A0A8J5KD52_ZINOF|nr:hypothetical protein ZIOFF_065399 [Zingiber officinale]